MNKSLRQIVREEIRNLMSEAFGAEDPVKLAQNIVKSNEEQLKNLEAELKFRENDARVSGLPPEEKKARIERVNHKKKELELAKQELELAKQAELSAVQMQQQAQSSSDESQAQTQSQVGPQSPGAI
jgi:hypothetical protein